MNILLLGSGGREHALAWKIAASPLVAKLWCAPGNAGIAREAECVAVDITDRYNFYLGIDNLTDRAPRLGNTGIGAGSGKTGSGTPFGRDVGRCI